MTGGNERPPFVATDVLPRINGRRIAGNPARLHVDTMSMFEAGELEFARLERWLRGW